VQIASLVVSLSLAAMLSAPRTASADVVLRMGVIAPEGTAWARELNAFARDVEMATHGEVRIKWYLGGIAGDELAMIARARRGQLDGMAVSITCSRLAPSLRVTRLIGLFQRHDEEHFILNKLYPILEEELRKNGFANLGIAVIGSEIILSRQPVRTMADFRKQRFWIWNLDDVWLDELPRLKLATVPMAVDQAAAAFDQGKVDGFLAIPTAALAFQWSVRAHDYTAMHLGFLPACLLMTNQSFDALPIETQNQIRAAGAKLGKRFDEINRAQEQQLVGGLFEHQGSHQVPLDTPTGAQFRAEFFEEARRIRDQTPESVVPHEFIQRVTAWLADFRAEHR
jgi:TRAP-type C4-dicarboxylate transport system substrate-binding protein